MDSHYDLAVIGAGIFGIQAIRTYLDIHNEANVVAFEENEHAGGVWGKSRLYPFFWSQGSWQNIVFSDRSDVEIPKENRLNLVPAKYVADYIEEYLDDHEYNGAPLRSRIRTNFTVTGLSKNEDGIWNISGFINSKDEPKKSIYFSAKKVIVASGFTSVPRLPSLREENFRGEVVHMVDFGREADRVLSPPTPAKHICVLGGAKSAADMAYAAAKCGHEVSWIIRKDGSGPGLFAPVEKMGMYHNLTEFMVSRFSTVLSPNLFMNNWLTWFLHRTVVGRWIIRKIFESTRKSAEMHIGFGARENALEGFENLRTEASPFWANAGVGMGQHEDFWPVIAENVRIFRENISHLSDLELHLENGTVLSCDVLLLGTGFREEYPFLNANEHRRLGLSHSRETDAEEKVWARLSEEADSDLLERFPMLKESPGFEKYPARTPHRLYNRIAPISDSTIAFVGCIVVPSMFMAAEMQALWACAYLDGTINLPQKAEMMRTVAMDNQWSRRRYPWISTPSGHGLPCECVLYADALLKELGCTSHVDGTSLWDWWMKPNFQAIFKGVVGEYKTKLKNVID